MAIDREVFAAVCLIAVFALFCDVSLKHQASAQSPVCQNFATGCPETTSTQSQGSCLQPSGSSALLGVVTDTQNCARYVFCTGPGSGIAFKCPVGTVPGNICVPDPYANTTNQCDPPCTTVDGCLIGPAQGNDSTVCPPPSSGIPLTVVSHPDYCGVFILCISGNFAFEYKCPTGYRGLSGSIMEPKCAPDPTCKAWNDSHPAPCTNANTGCQLTLPWINLPICQNFTSTLFGIFDYPNQCGRYMACFTSQQGMVFECPYGYRASALAYPRCIADPSCHYPTAPRTPIMFGAGHGTPCLDHYIGCIVRTTNYVSCNNTASGTVFIDNVQCGYWTECSGSGSNATVRVCPAGYRSNSIHGNEGICESDSSGCPTPESPRMLTLSSGLHHTNACLNVAFGCVVPRSTRNSSHIWNECLNRSPWTSVPEILNCRRYIICLPGSHGIEVECPNGYRATPNAIGEAQCSVDSSCS